MNLHEAMLETEKFLQRVSYKPNTRFSAELDSRSDCIVMRMFMDVPDVDNQSSATTLHSAGSFPVEMLRGEDFLMYFVRKLIFEMESHERDEWLKLDGKHVNDPHPKKVA